MRFILLLFISLFAVTSNLAETISVAAAVSLKEALMQVASNYKTTTGDEVQFTFGASGQLAAQIQGGAPIDLFISAANRQVDDLFKAKLLIPDTRKVIAGNTLVLIVPAGAKSKPVSLKDLAAEVFARIAIGEPKSVPAGQYAEQTLKSAGIYDSIRSKLIFASNVRQVLDYVERGEVSAGLVYATDAKASGEKIEVAFGVDSASHDPIVYPAAVVADSKQRAAAEKFLDYLLSEPAQREFAKFGFSSPPPAPVSEK